MLIVVAGVGLGLLIRNSMRGSGGPTTAVSAETNPDSLPATQGAPTILQQDFDSIRTIQDEQDRLADELDARDERNLQRQEEFFTDIRKRISNIVIPGEKKAKTQPVGDPVKGPSSKPKPKPKSEDQRIKESIINIFNEEQLKVPGKLRMSRLITEVKQGRSLQDIRAGLEAYKSNRPELGIPV